LDGDGYFLESLREAFQGLKTEVATSPDDVPIDLVMTTTLPARALSATMLMILVAESAMSLTAR
jgi:hypothetical protein